MTKRLAKYYVRAFLMRFGGYERRFVEKTGRRPNFDDPKTFTDKLAWMRLHDHNPLYTQLVDKIAVRDYVRERVGEDVLIPLYGTWAKARDIDFDSLPESFVLKCNHESGFVVLCHDKARLDTTYVKAQLATRLKMNYYHYHHEWPYLHVKPRVLAERLLVGDDGGEPHDYKIHCFDGQPAFIIAVKDRHTRQVQGCYSPDWEPLPFAATMVPPVEIPRPVHLERMLEIARALAKGLPCCRVDLYAVEDKVYFGELTLIIGAGLLKYYPDSYDLHWGERFTLPPATDAGSRHTRGAAR